MLQDDHRDQFFAPLGVRKAQHGAIGHGGMAELYLGDMWLPVAGRRFDLIVLDAFSSDAIPVHLITREALQMYTRKLRPGGIVAFHISNRYLELEPVLVELARDARLAGASANRDVTAEQKAQLLYGSRWVVMAASAHTLAPLVRDAGWSVLAPTAKARVATQTAKAPEAGSNVNQRRWRATGSVRSSSNSEDLPNFSGAGLYSTVPNVTQAADLGLGMKVLLDWVAQRQHWVSYRYQGGTLRHGLILQQIRFENAKVRVLADQAVVKLGWRALLSKELHFSRASVQHLQIIKKTPPSKEPFRFFERFYALFYSP